ncbi:MAG: hypothetical protein AABW58_00325 [Nanoarchaeota archaeon]
MPIVGFNFSKVHVEKKETSETVTNIQIKNDVLITNVQEEKLPTGKTKADGLKFDFKFHLKYEPSVGEIELIGFIYYLDDPETIKDIYKSWKKDKKIPQEITANLVNTVLIKGTIKALNLSQEVNLPPHLPLPTVNPKATPESYIG